jgi:intein/homing endonuclease
MTDTFSVPAIMDNIKEEAVGAYLESEHRHFAIYTLQQRAIPFFNGMKPVQQRCLWQLRGTTKYEKVAKLTGQVMAIHPHGDCVEYDTEVLLADGSYIKIGEWVEQNPEAELLIKAYDREKGEFVTAEAKPTNGKVVDELVEIEMENGEILKVSTDHKVLLSDGITYIEAKDLTEKHEIKSF